MKSWWRPEELLDSILRTKSILTTSRFKTQKTTPNRLESSTCSDSRWTSEEETTSCLCLISLLLRSQASKIISVPLLFQLASSRKYSAKSSWPIMTNTTTCCSRRSQTDLLKHFQRSCTLPWDANCGDIHLKRSWTLRSVSTCNTRGLDRPLVIPHSLTTQRN